MFFCLINVAVSVISDRDCHGSYILIEYSACDVARLLLMDVYCCNLRFEVLFCLMKVCLNFFFRPCSLRVVQTV